MRIFPSHRAVRRAQLRFMVRFVGVLAVVMLAFGGIVAAHYFLGWW